MIPAWNMAGVVPPVRPGVPGHHRDRSPYLASLTDFVDGFAFSLERIAILQGFFQYRAALHSLGLVKGFQWLDGSFLENVESQESRAPNDIDVVTYFDLPAGIDEPTLVLMAGDIFKQPHVKSTYKVDAYLHILGEPTDVWEIKTVSYWYSMWSHNRAGMWKGFVQVDLSPASDNAAIAMLATKSTALNAAAISTNTILANAAAGPVGVLPNGSTLQAPGVLT